ncbi:TetR family transcriptional regulator [Novosphingobium kunmingense]|uniref:TetR family transcriptional regulator n=1 Tax=Novosphingobium kunmingense TaxID=1211806 RepID=A0A2N0I3N4_9SPHN|nr:TetR/AcrR family transcriptional regulator [Novosphingobium kunmingense]PKB25802.1 TetR family transcriptional regulator [Novosphingobium kunmingense]
MIPNVPFRPAPATARDRILEAAVALVRSQGFGATSVDQLCRAAGVTKGAFFHHFASKEALGVALAGYWSANTGAFFAEAPYHHHPRAIDRVLGYIDLRSALLAGPPEAFSCVAGTMLQESFRSSAAIRQACEASIMGNAAALEDDIAQALTQAGLDTADAPGLARYIQVAIQGAFIVAKTQESEAAAPLAAEALAHLRRYFELLFNEGERDAG